MTYVVGLRDGDTAVVLCDSRVTFERDPSLNSALKSGRLFPGCHYAAVGDAEPMRRFVVRVKTFLTGRNTPSGFWNAFLGYAVAYDRFEDNRSFTLLLMSNHTGRPRLYTFESRSRAVTECGDVVTLGSGKPLLDPIINALWHERHAGIRAEISERGAPAWFFGYYYCLALMELAQGDAFAELNRIGVGGAFHFSYQTSTEDSRQHPAVYAIVSAFEQQRILTYTLYRITFEKMALVVENGAERSFSISIDEAVWPAIAGYDGTQRTELAASLQKGALEQPFYNFLGLGFSSDALRQNWLIHVNLGTNDFALSRTELHNEAVTQFALACATGDLKERIVRALNEPSN